MPRYRELSDPDSEAAARSAQGPPAASDCEQLAEHDRNNEIDTEAVMVALEALVTSWSLEIPVPSVFSQNSGVEAWWDHRDGGRHKGGSV